MIFFTKLAIFLQIIGLFPKLSSIIFIIALPMIIPFDCLFNVSTWLGSDIPNPTHTGFFVFLLTFSINFFKLTFNFFLAHKIDEFIKLEEINKCLNFLNGVKDKSIQN